MDHTDVKEASKVTILDIASWAGFTAFASSAIIVAISLPEISRTFSTNYSEGGGMETARSIVMITMLLLAGILAQRLGQEKVPRLWPIFQCRRSPASQFLTKLCHAYRGALNDRLWQRIRRSTA